MVSGKPSGQVLAIVKELQSMLDVLVKTGEENYVDVLSVSLTPDDIQTLKLILGHGDVDATIVALGSNHILETSIPGVWWITQNNTEGEIISELIEVTDLPEILKTQHHDLHEAPERFQQRLSELNLN
jgi:hydrogenase-1 operon protein HyaF